MDDLQTQIIKIKVNLYDMLATQRQLPAVIEQHEAKLAELIRQFQTQQAKPKPTETITAD
jgi:hypothetical protein